ncbi:MAG TPA: hypothetical protein VN711_03160 [Candidatus Saccharimonadales bacterium]|nr:hypothetical protein [Candidatus Saccharimonadales bacterium]
MTQTLAIRFDNQDKKKEQLQSAILRKRQQLEEITTKVEMLQLELQLVRHEYHVRIGALVLKDNQLDLEILQLRNLKELMESGMSYAEALRHEEDAFYNEILRMQKEQEEIDEEKQMLDRRKDVSEEVENEIKKLWKTLIRKFHPDLVLDSAEKTKREAAMKEINRAYAENDLEILKRYENNMEIDDIAISSIERLEKILVDTENRILMTRMEYEELKLSEWYNWKMRKEKAKKRKKEEPEEDIFRELENDLLDDITKKIIILQGLRQDVGHHPVL